MNISRTSVRLSREEIKFLTQSDFLDIHQLDMLSRAECSEEQINLELNINTAEEFREKFTLELTRVGFDDNYQLTTEGKLLEDLIDRFFISDV